MELKVGNRVLNVRKWKGKDKKNFINMLKSKQIDGPELMNGLVYDCIEEDVALSIDEFRYVLSRIRAESIGENFSVEFLCDSCKSVFTKEFKLKDTIKYTFKDIKEINVPGVIIKLGDIKNKEFYLKKIEEDPDYDFLLRIESINGDDTMTLEQVEYFIENLDMDVLSEVMKIYDENRFKIQDVNTVVCECGKETEYIFDEIPGFLPESWFE